MARMHNWRATKELAGRRKHKWPDAEAYHVHQYRKRGQLVTVRLKSCISKGTPGAKILDAIALDPAQAIGSFTKPDIVESLFPDLCEEANGGDQSNGRPFARGCPIHRVFGIIGLNPVYESFLLDLFKTRIS